MSPPVMWHKEHLWNLSVLQRGIYIYISLFPVDQFTGLYLIVPFTIINLDFLNSLSVIAALGKQILLIEHLATGTEY
jgi:hypothetical protein